VTGGWSTVFSGYCIHYLMYKVYHWLVVGQWFLWVLYTTLCDSLSVIFNRWDKECRWLSALISFLILYFFSCISFRVSANGLFDLLLKYSFHHYPIYIQAFTVYLPVKIRKRAKFQKIIRCQWTNFKNPSRPHHIIDISLILTLNEEIFTL